MQGVHHVGILVKSLEYSMPYYRNKLGLKFEGTELNKKSNVEIAFFRAGDTLLTLLEPKGEGDLKKYLDENGEGIHHIAFEVEDIDESLENLKKKNTPLVDSTPREGAKGSKIAFLKSSDLSSNVIVELIQP